MKRAVLMSVVGLSVMLLAANAALARPCEYYQWTRQSCPGIAKSAPAPVAAVPRIEKGEKLVLDGIYFDTGSARIKKESFPVLDENAQKIGNSKKDVRIVIVGYTDDRGSDAMNQKLSEARANSVRTYLVSKGVTEDRISSTGKGESDPIADNTTDTGRAKNRRIEMQAK